MLDDPFNLLPLVIAIVALIVAIKSLKRAEALRVRLDFMQQLAADRAVPPPLPRVQTAEPAKRPVAAMSRPAAPTCDATGRPRRRIHRARFCLRIPAGNRGPSAGPAAAAAGAGPRIRGNRRHPLGGVDRRADAGARRILHGPLFDRCRPAQPRRAWIFAGCSHWRCSPPANGPGARKASPPSKRCRSPTFQAILTAAGTAVAFATVYAAMRSTASWCPPPPSCARNGGARHARCGVLHGPALAGFGMVGAFATPVWSRQTSRTSGRSTSISRSSPRRRSALRGCGCGAGSRSPRLHLRCCGRCPACNAARRWWRRMRSMCWPDLSSLHCWWCAASCSGHPRIR